MDSTFASSRQGIQSHHIDVAHITGHRYLLAIFVDKKNGLRSGLLVQPIHNRLQDVGFILEQDKIESGHTYPQLYRFPEDTTQSRLIVFS
jgi:hypothetical protein